MKKEEIDKFITYPLDVKESYRPDELISMIAELLSELTTLEEKVKELEKENTTFRNACQDWEVKYNGLKGGRWFL